MLWPDVDQSQGYASLRVVLSELRKALGSEGVRLQSPDRHTLLLDLTGAESDVRTFDATVASKRQSALKEAVALYRGPLLEGCNEEWVFQDRAARERQCLEALLKLGDSALSFGEYASAAGYFQRAVSLDPWWDTARRGLMEALSRSGDSNAALQVYREFVEALRSDPKAVPDEKTSALYLQLRANARLRADTHAVVNVEAAAPRVVKGYLPHPLTDIVGREDERLEIAIQLRRSRLVTLTGLGGIGKTRLAREVAQDVIREYADGVWLVALEALTDGRLVVQQIATVLGLREEPGRTPLQTITEHLRRKRLLLVLDNCEHLLEASAQAVAHQLTECAEVRILATSREALGITGETSWSVPALALPDTEHLPQGRATLLRVLMSYESVQLFVERAQAIHKTFTLNESNARTVATVCAKLDGIPLAIELAAARIKVMTVEQIATRLDDHLGLLTGGSRIALARQQTLRATLDWSYALLDESERRLLRRVSVFAEGWSLEAAEAVCKDEGGRLKDEGGRLKDEFGQAQPSTFNLQPSEILDLLTSLADKSLVAFEERETGGRYRLLEMVRQYGAENLDASGEADRVRSRHRDYYLALAEEAEPELTGPDQGAWLARLEAERANLRAALNCCMAEEHGAMAGLQLAGALSRFWEMHGHYSEGRAYLAEALARDGALARTRVRARALIGAGVLSYYQGDYMLARSLHEESLAIYRDLGDRQGAAWALNDLGDVFGAQGNRDSAKTLYEESLAIFRELKNLQGMAALLHHLGRVIREQGDFAGASAKYEESAAISRKLGNRENVAWSLHHLGNVAAAEGEYTRSRSLEEEGLAIFRELGNREGIAWSLNEIAHVALLQADYETACTLYEESLAIFRQLGNRQGAASLLHHLGRAVCERGDFSAARSMFDESMSIFQELGNRQGEGWLLNALGRAAMARGDYEDSHVRYEEGARILTEFGDKRGAAERLEGLAAILLAHSESTRAVRVLAAVNRLRATIAAPLPSSEQKKLDSLLERAHAAMDGEAFAAAWKQGCALTLEEAVALAVKKDEPTRNGRMSETSV